MAKCSLDTEAFIRFIEKVGRDLKNEMAKETPMPFNLKTYMTKIYDQALEKSNDPNLAAAYAKAIPAIINRLQSINDEVNNYVIGDIVNIASQSRLYKDEANDNVLKYIGRGIEKAVVVNNTSAKNEALNNTATKERDLIKEKALIGDVEFEARPRSFLTSTTAEVKSIDPSSEDYNVPFDTPKEKLKSAIQRRVVKAFSKNNISDQGGIEYEGVEGGLFLTAFSDMHPDLDFSKLPESRIDYWNQEQKTGEEGFKQNKDGVEFILTNADGDIIHFDEEYNVVGKEAGTPVVLSLRGAKEYGEPDYQVMPIRDFAKKLVIEYGFSYPEAEALAIEIRESEKALVKRVRTYLKNNPNEKVTVNITGGSEGYLPVDFSKRIRVTSIKNLDDFELNIDADKGYTVIRFKGTTENIPTQKNKLSKDITDKIAAFLIYPSLRATTNKPISLQEKADILKGYYGADKVFIDQDNNQVVVKRSGSELTFEITDDLEKASAIADELSAALSQYYLTDKIVVDGKSVPITEKKYASIPEYSKIEFFNPDSDEYIGGKYYAEGNKYYQVRQLYADHNKKFEGKSFDFIDKVDFSKGVPRVTFKKSSYNNYILSTLTSSVVLNGQGKVLKLNPYFNWTILKGSKADTQVNQVSAIPVQEPTTEPEINEVYQVNETPEIIKESEVATEKSAADIFNEIKSNPDNFKKTIRQKLNDKTKVKQKLDEIEKWYNSTDLKGKIPLHMLFTAPNNTEYADAVATLDENGISLWFGADASDVYHEAWHGFSQYFITPEERAGLYNETRKLKGSFVDFNGKSVDFTDAGDLQLEEHIAEGFREFKLSGGKKVLDRTPIRNKIFQRIYAFLEWLFGKSSYRHALADIKALDKVREYYETLSIGKLGRYKFDPRNVQFRILKTTGIKPLDSKLDDTVYLNTTESMLLNQSVDSLFSKLAYELSKTGDPSFTYNIIAKEGTRKQAYAYVLATFKEQLKALTEQSKELKEQEASIYDIQNVDDNIRILTFAVTNFGNIENLNANEPGRGLIGFHRLKSEYISFEDKFDEEIQKQKESEGKQWDKAGNEQSMNDLMPAELKYILNSLSSGKQNRLGYDIPVSYKTVVNRFTKTIANNTGDMDIYNRILKASDKYPPFKELLVKLGNPTSDKLGTQKIWNAINSVGKVSEVILKQLTINKVNYGEYNPTTRKRELLEEPKYELSFGESFGDYKSVQMGWESRFRSLSGRYVTVKDDERSLNLNNILEDFPTKESALNNKRGFLQAIGITFSENPEIDAKLDEVRKDGTTIGRVDRLWDIVKGLNAKKIKVSSIDDIFKNNTRVNKDFTNEYTNYKDLAELELKYSDLYSNFSKTTAEGNTQYTITKNNSILEIANNINSPATFQDMVSRQETNHFDTRRNPFTRSSFQMNSVFDLSTGKKRTDKKGNPIKVSVDNLSGITLTEDDTIFVDGISLAKTDKPSKFINDIHTLLGDGTKENLRHADKVTSFSESVSNIHGTDSDGMLYIDTSRFINDEIGKESFSNAMMRYVIAEHDRINMIKNAKPGDPVLQVPFYRTAGKEFAYFDGILSTDTKDKLYAINTDPSNNDSLLQRLGYDYNDGYLVEISNEPDQIKLREQIKDDIKEYFSNKVGEIAEAYKKINIYDQNLIDKIKKEALKNQIKYKDDSEIKNAILRSYFANSLIHNIELTVLFYGDIVQYGHYKKELSKRIAGSGSTGPIPRTSAAFEAFINSDTFGGRMLSKKMGIDYPYKNIINTAVIADDIVQSVYFDKYTKRAKNDISNRFALLRRDETWSKLSKEEQNKIIDNQVSNQYKPYNKLNAADAEGYISFDAYRILSFALNQWSTEQERMYRDIVAGKKLDPNKILETFPVRKYQNFGPLATDTLPIHAFHKFSLLPLIPTMIKGKKLQKLHEMMIKQKVDYVVFESGSKVSTITPDGKKADVLYKDGKIDTSVTFTINPVYTGFIKEQLTINNEYKGKSTFASQMRKIGSLGLYEGGIPSDFKPEAVTPEEQTQRRLEWGKLTKDQKDKFPNHVLNQRYKQHLTDLQDAIQSQLLAEINWKMVDGKPQGSMKNLLDLIEREFVRDGRPEYDKEFLNTDKDGNLIRDLSMLNNSSRVEKMLIALAEKRLIRQKLTGEPLVQTSSTMFEDIDHEVPKYKLATEEQMKEFGSSDLPFYDFDIIKGKKGKETYSNTYAAGIKIALQGPFKNLLLLKHIDGKPIGTRERLNKMITNEKWLNTDNNKKLISTISVRIPVGERNFLDYFQIYEFLPEESGPIVVLPKEIVAKNGSDFDVDKLMSNFMSTIVVNGEVIYHNEKVSKEKAREYFDKINASKEERKIKKAIKRELKPVANIPQNLVSGVEAFGTIQEANSKVKAALGDNATSIDMIEAGFRTRTTRSKKEMDKYNIKVGDIVKQFGKSADGTTKEVYTEITAIHPKGTPGYTATWEKEGWTKEGLKAIKRFKAGAAAIEFKIVPTTSIEEVTEIEKPTEQDFDKFYAKLNVDAFSNAINEDLRSIFERPENFTFLTNASSNYIYDPIVKFYEERGIKNNTIKNWKLNHKGEETKWYDNEGKKVSSISPTTSIEPLFDLETHNLNNVGKDVTGITASSGGTSPVFIDAGVYMNPYRGQGTIEEYTKALETPAFERTDRQNLILKTFRKQEVRIPHNYLLVNEKGELDPNGAYKVPDLSRMYDANGNNPNSEVGSQTLNGSLEVAKDPWLALINISKETAPTAMYMKTIGVPLDVAEAILNQPLVLEYSNLLKEVRSAFAQFRGYEIENPNFYRIVARGIILNTRLGYAKKDVTGPGSPTRVYQIIENATLGKFWTLDDLLGTLDTKEITPDTAAIFLHFLELEDMAKYTSSLTRAISMDTSTESTLITVLNKNVTFENIQHENAFPKEVINRIKDNSQISSLFNREFIAGLYKPLFNLRNNSFVTDFFISKLKEGELEDYIDELGDLDKTASNFLDVLTNYIFQNTLYGSATDTVDKDLAQGYYKGITATDNIPAKKIGLIGKFETKVIKDKGEATLYYNTDFIKEGYKTANKMIYPTFKSYQQYVFERAYQEYQNPKSEYVDSSDYERRLADIKNNLVNRQLKDETDEAYEERMSDLAYKEYIDNKSRMNTFNFYQLFHSAESFADIFNELKFKYSRQNQLGGYMVFNVLEANKSKRSNTTNLRLKTTELTGDDLNIIHENIKELGNERTLNDLVNRGVLDIKDPVDIKRIADFFRQFTYYAYLQSGIGGKGAFGIQSLGLQPIISRLMYGPMKSYVNTFNKAYEALQKAETEGFDSLSDQDKAQYQKGNALLTSIYDQFRAVMRDKERFRYTDLTVTPIVTRSKASMVEYAPGIFLYDTKVVKNAKQADEYFKAIIADKDPSDFVFVINGHEGVQAPEKQASLIQHLKDTGAEVLTIPVKASKLEMSRFTDKTLDENKNKIDKALDEIQNRVENRKNLVFSNLGYGQIMIGKSNLSESKEPNTGGGEETFVYLSKELYKRFGYLNNNFQERPEFELEETDNDTVRDFMRLCLTPGSL